MLFVSGLKIKEINVYRLRDEECLCKKTSPGQKSKLYSLHPPDCRKKKNFYKNEIILLLRIFKRGAAFCVISGFNSSDSNAASQTELTIDKFF